MNNHLRHLLQKINIWLLIILLIGLFLRAFHPLSLFQYSHDQDLAGWFIRDVLINHHLRLIGQETSSHGIFIGPYFYYLQIPFYLLTHLDPSGALLLSIILGTAAIFSVYFVFSKIFSQKIALIGSLLYSMSTLIIFTEREVVPTQPVMLWTIWFFFSLWLIYKGKKNAYLLTGFLMGLIWSINLQLVILLPLVLLAQLFSKKQLRFKEISIAILIALILNIPFFAFEVRHGFQQTKALVLSLSTSKDYVPGTSHGFLAKLDRTMQLVYKNSTNLFSVNYLNIDPKIMFWILIISLLILVYKKQIQSQFGILMFLWIVTYILFFSKISLNISEYYLNGINIIYIAIAAFVIRLLLENKKYSMVGFSIITLFITFNLQSFFTRQVNEDGYIERKEVLSYIKEDAKKNGYPCVSLSFITSPGNDLGYRYFTWELGIKTKPISNSVPVYTIVFPLSKVDSFSKSFGSLGVVNPDYKRYNLKTIEKACEGNDYTLTQPLFGFTN